MKTEVLISRLSCRFTLTLLAAACLIALPLSAARGGSIRLQCWEYDRGNARVVVNPGRYGDYRDKMPGLMMTGSGKTPFTVEYDLDIPVTATWKLRVRYASAGVYPLNVLIDNKKVGTCCGEKTDNAPPYMDRHPNVYEGLPKRTWHLHGAQWEDSCEIRIAAGKRTLKFTSDTPPSNLIEIQLTTKEKFPKEWKPVKREVDLTRIPPMNRRHFLPAGSVNPVTLRMTIVDKIKTFGAEYPKGPEHLKQFDALQAKQTAVGTEGGPEQWQALDEQWNLLRKSVMLDHPELKFDRLIFVKRFTRNASVYTGHRDYGNPGGNLCVLSPVSPDGKVTELVPELTGGVFGRFDLSFDATRVVFNYTKSKEGAEQYRIYEIQIDPAAGCRAKGTPLVQLTVNPRMEDEPYGGKVCRDGYNDMDPIYLPDGRIMFASSRSRRSVLCAPQTSTTLHVMAADGKNMRCVSGAQVNELSPSLMHDGRIVYTRWEYIDKGFGNVQSLWSMRPDGSGPDHVYKNMVVCPGAMINACSIPGSRKVAVIGIGHHGGLAGPMILIDTRSHRRTADAMTNLTPEIEYPGLYPRTRNKGAFAEPYPFSEKFFLVSHGPAGTRKNSAAHALYVLDAFGNRAELYRDPDIACHQPVPLRTRKMPVNITPVDDTNAVHTAYTKSKGLATMFLQDVYRGLPGIKRGRVKYVRVMAAMNLSWNDAVRAGKQGDGAGMEASAVSGGGDVSIKKIYGIVKVHEDGSAYFRVPANRNVFFQALDENYMELHRMRTFINLRPGESRSCIGCHEFRRNAPGLKPARPLAMKYPVVTPSPQPGDTGPRTVHYAADIQPIFDKHCLGCHSGEKAKGQVDLTGALTTKFNRSYETLTKKKKRLVSYLEGGFGSANVPAEPPLSFGSHRSILVRQIKKAPCKSKITRNEFIKIVTWIDANAPFYGTHEGKKNIKWKDDPDFRPLPIAGK
jgi:hypothetical protein